MQEIVRISLDNEMDLILAHKRSMKIAELCGLPQAAQTRFSTAVSEIARCSIANGKHSYLELSVDASKAARKSIVATLHDTVDLKQCNPDAYAYAARISGNVAHEKTGTGYETQLSHVIPSPGLISDKKLKDLRDYFKYEPPLSPYDEIRKKNLELVALSERLAESENQYRQLADSLPLLVFTIDSRNRISLVNSWVKRYLGKAPATFDRNGFAGLIWPQDLEHLMDKWEVARSSKSAYQGEVRLEHSGHQVWHLVSIVPNKSADGTVADWSGVFVDIHAQKLVEETLQDNTELREIERQLVDKNKELNLKNQQLEQFAYIASHDLQEPLRKIMMMVSRASAAVNAEDRERLYFNKLSQSAQRMSNLIHDVLNYSRLEDISSIYQLVDLNQVAADTVQELELLIQEKGAAINWDVLPSIQGVSAQLRQLFFNLFTNSLKFNEGAPEINIRLGHVSADQAEVELVPLEKGYHTLRFTDNGIGIQEPYAAKIFNMFQRLHHRDAYSGNGIGLALCRKIAEKHGGAIAFSGTGEAGTTFTVFLPVS